MDIKTNKRSRTMFRPELPDDIIRQIIPFLPIKSALRMSFLAKRFVGCRSSVELDLQEDEITYGAVRDNDTRHRDFIKKLENSLKFLEEGDKHLLTLRLHMTRYSSRTSDNIWVDRCLEFAINRNVQELDIRLRRASVIVQYDFSPWAFRLVEKAEKSLTTVNLNRYNSVRIPSLKFIARRTSDSNKTTVELTTSFKKSFKNKTLCRLIFGCPILEKLSIANFDCSDKMIYPEPQLRDKHLITITLENVRIGHNFVRILPSSETLCLKNVHLSATYLSSFMSRCQCLSIDSCSTNSDDSRMQILEFTNTSLRSLDVVDSKAEKLIVIGNLRLEFFNYVSQSSDCTWAVVDLTRNLRYMNIHAEHLRSLTLSKGNKLLEASIVTPNLYKLNIDGCLSWSNISLEAPNLFRTTKIVFDADAQVLTFPANVIESISSPMPNVQYVDIHGVADSNYSDLYNSLLWMAPSAEITIYKK